MYIHKFSLKYLQNPNAITLNEKFLPRLLKNFLSRTKIFNSIDKIWSWLVSHFTYLPFHLPPPPPPRRQKKSAPPQFKISAALIKACICTWNHQLRCITDDIRHRPPSWEQHSRSIFLLVVVGTPVSSVVLYTLRLSLSCSGVSPSRGRWKVGEKWAPRKEGEGGGGRGAKAKVGVTMNTIFHRAPLSFGKSLGGKLSKAQRRRGAPPLHVYYIHAKRGRDLWTNAPLSLSLCLSIFISPSFLSTLWGNVVARRRRCIVSRK